MVHGRRLPNSILEDNAFGPFHTLREPITYMPTKVRKNISFDGRDMPPKRNSKPTLWRQNSISGFNFDNCHLSGTLLCIIVQNSKKIAQRTAELLRFNLSLPTFKPTL